MNILAIDSVTPVLSITAEGKDGTVTISFDSPAQHAEMLIPLIEQAIRAAGFTARETDIVTCAEGPGSFTGLRIAFAAAKGIALSSGCAFIPVPTLPCYAKGFGDWPGAVVSVLDAKKERFYAQVFRKGEAVTDALDIPSPEIMRYLDPAERILITGPDADLFLESLSLSVPGLDAIAVSSDKSVISRIMCEFAKNGQKAYTKPVPDHTGPVYVRKSDAESNTIGKKS